MVRKKLLIPILAAVVASCGGSNLSFSVRGGGSSAAAAAFRSSDLTVASGIVLTRVRLVLREIELERVGGNDNDDTDDEKLESAATVIDLQGTALDGASIQTVVNAAFTPGTYHEIKFKIHKPSSDESTNAAVKEMAALGASVAVEGKIDGVDFTFVSAVEAQQKYEGNLVLTDGSNLTLDLNPANWFGASVAARLDPRVSGNRSQIESNIKASFHAFKDDDHDGHED